MRHTALSVVKDPFTIMGILNTTPDSFYDGGRLDNAESAFVKSRELIAAGATIIDVGGESSRPGADPVSVDEECARTIPVIKKIRNFSDVVISIDTVKSLVAKEALAAGADVVNDVSGGRFDVQMSSVVSEACCPVVVMHSRKKPKDMQENPAYEKTVEEVIRELQGAISVFTEAGVSHESIIVDPGIGFAKQVSDNLLLLAHIDKIVSLGYPVLLGVSRKSFIGAITGSPVENRLSGSLASLAEPFFKGVKIFRVHDVKETVDFLTILNAIRTAA